MNVVVNLYLTWKCNFYCAHCIHECGPKVEEHMTKEQIDYAFGFLDWIKANDTLNLCVLGLTGGEPTLHPEFWSYIMPKLKEYKDRTKFSLVEIHTNGSIPVPTDKYNEYNNFFSRVIMSNDVFHQQFMTLDRRDLVGYSAISRSVDILNNGCFLPSVVGGKNDYTEGLKVYPIRLKGRAREEFSILNKDKSKFELINFTNSGELDCTYVNKQYGFNEPRISFVPNYINYCGEKSHKNPLAINNEGQFNKYGLPYEALITNSIKYGICHSGKNCSNPCYKHFVALKNDKSS